jgi:hypothetical protein
MTAPGLPGWSAAMKYNMMTRTAMIPIITAIITVPGPVLLFPGCGDDPLPGLSVVSGIWSLKGKTQKI